MPYTPQAWANGNAGGTPISAARLAYMEAGIAAAYDPPASTTEPGLVQLAKDFGGTSTEPTVPPLGEMVGGTKAAQGMWVAPGRIMAPTILVEGVTSGLVFRVGRACTIDRVAVQVTTAGSSGSVVRIGIYKLAYSATGALVATLLYDAGTVSGTTVAVVEANLTTPLPVPESTGLWVTATGQGTPTTQPVLASGDLNGLSLPFSTSTAALGNLGGLQASGNPSALPTSPTVSATNVPAPRVALRTSV